MTKALYLLGAPGVGKSTALQYLFPSIRGAVAYSPAGYPLMKLSSIGPNAAMLGVWRESFPGTDGLSMAVLPQAVKWAADEPLPHRLVGEGQRLGHIDFFAALATRTDLMVVWMMADELEMAQRTSLRTQNPQWAKAAATRARNVAKQCVDYKIDVLMLNTTTLTPPNVAEILAKYI